MDLSTRQTSVTNQSAVFTRRSFLNALGLAAAGASLTACGINPAAVRFDNAPTPTVPVPDASELLRDQLRLHCIAVRRLITGHPEQPTTTGELTEFTQQLTTQINALGPKYASELPDHTPAPDPAPTAAAPATAAATATAAKEVAQIVVTHLNEAHGTIVPLACTIWAHHVMWSHWLSKTTPEQLALPNTKISEGSPQFHDALRDALSTRHAAIYHYGALAQNATQPVTDVLRKHLTRHTGTAALVTEVARISKAQVPVPATAYQALPQKPLAENGVALEQACIGATQKVLAVCPTTLREWLTQVLLHDAVQLASWRRSPANLLAT